MTKTMRAVVQHEFGGPEVLALEHIDIPQPLPTEVQVEVHFAGVNPVDGKVRLGASVAAAMGDFPWTLGWDVAGVISAVGVGVTRFAVGDRVFGMPRFPRMGGSYAEYLTAPSRHLVKVPDSLNLENAAAVPLPATTAYQALVDVAQVASGQSIAILGAAGSVGAFAVQIAKSLGATVIGTARSNRIDSLHKLGVDRAVDSDREDMADAIQDADMVLDLIGGEFNARALGLVRPGGLVISLPSGDKSALQQQAERDGKRLTGFIVEPDRVALEYVAALIQSGKVQVSEPMIMEFGDVVEVHSLLDAGTGKMVLKVS